MKSDYLGILFYCPVGERVQNCPLQTKELHSFHEKWLWFEALTEVERDTVINHHIHCSNSRNCRKLPNHNE